MKKTREIVQAEAFNALEENNYTGTVCLSTGTGKSKVGIDVIKKGQFKNILITGPRTNLKENWEKELKKWLHTFKIHNRETKMYHVFGQTSYLMNQGPTITLENIQTCYKWSCDKIREFDLIICDEIHLLITNEYGELIMKSVGIDIPVVGLTATKDTKDKPDKALFYKTYCPILYEYYNSAKDGIINKRRYLIYNYNLSNDYKVQVNTKSKSWKEGELKRYNYIENMFISSKKEIEEFYFNKVKENIKEINKREIRNSYKRYFNSLISRDLEHFRNIYWTGMKNKKFPYDLYLLLREIQGVDYAKFGMKAAYWATAAPESIQPYFYKYIWARNERKKFLWNLNSSASSALKIKEVILSDIHNKVLLFSENIKQAEKLSNSVIHSKRKSKVNTKILKDFDEGVINELASVRSLTLGLNIKGANYIIRESYNGSEVNSTQINGRGDRLDVEDTSTIIWIVPTNTQSEEWFKKAIGNTEDIDIEYFDDINKLIKNI